MTASSPRLTLAPAVHTALLRCLRATPGWLGGSSARPTSPPAIAPAAVAAGGGYCRVLAEGVFTPSVAAGEPWSPEYALIVNTLLDAAACGGLADVALPSVMEPGWFDVARLSYHYKCTMLAPSSDSQCERFAHPLRALNARALNIYAEDDLDFASATAFCTLVAEASESLRELRLPYVGAAEDADGFRSALFQCKRLEVLSFDGYTFPLDAWQHLGSTLHTLQCDLRDEGGVTFRALADGFPNLRRLEVSTSSSVPPSGFGTVMSRLRSFRIFLSVSDLYKRLPDDADECVRLAGALQLPSELPELEDLSVRCMGIVRNGYCLAACLLQRSRRMASLALSVSCAVATFVGHDPQSPLAVSLPSLRRLTLQFVDDKQSAQLVPILTQLPQLRQLVLKETELETAPVFAVAAGGVGATPGIEGFQHHQLRQLQMQSAHENRPEFFEAARTVFPRLRSFLISETECVF